MTKNIGSAANAARALEIHAAYLEFDNTDEWLSTYVVEPDEDEDGGACVSTTVEGWFMLGSGCSRAVYLCPDDGVAYKVPVQSRFPWMRAANDNEWRVYQDYQRLSDPRRRVRLPRLSRYEIGDNVVLAAEHIDGSPTWDIPRFVNEFCASINMFDTHSWNILTLPNGQFVVVDFA